MDKEQLKQQLENMKVTDEEYDTDDWDDVQYYSGYNEAIDEILQKLK